MAAATHPGHSALAAAELLEAPRKPLARERHFSSVLPIELVRVRIARDFERGLSIASLCIMYQIRSKALQEILRGRLRELEAAMRRAGVVVACGLMAVLGVEAWRTVTAPGVVVARVVRGRRRSRGLEDGLAEVAEMARASVRSMGTVAL